MTEQMPKISDPMAKPGSVNVDMVAPDKVGMFGAAWRQRTTEIFQRHPTDVPIDLTVGAWVIHAPTYNPALPWQFWWVAAVALRPCPKFPNPNIFLDGATHEIVCAALHPDFPPALNDPVCPLHPFDFIGQWIATDDKQAGQYVEQTVHLILSGVLNPDSSDRQGWAARFQPNPYIPKTPTGDHTLH